jgi:HEAT repeat protein
LDAAIQSRDPLYLFGYPDQDFPNGCPVTFSCEGLTGDEPALIKFALGQVRPGISGAPLLNQRTGKVCGIVKFTRDRSFDLGGGAIPTRVILEQFHQLREFQQQFHQSDHRWLNLITTPTDIDFHPYLQAILTNEGYREWQDLYTPTTVEDRQRMPAQGTAPVSQRRFSARLKLRVETVKPDKEEQENQPDGVPEPQERVEQWDVLKGLRNYAAEHVVLIAKPGSGKSTSLERLLWEEADKALKDPNARIPVLVRLRRCTGTIEELIRDFLVSHDLALEMADIEKRLRQGKFLLLLDGLNELREVFRTEIANFRDRYRRTTPMIVSTRDLSVGGTLGIEKTLKMLPLTEPQMREFARGYLGEQGDRLFQQVKGDRLRKFAETPLLLWMLCRVFAQSGQVPANLGLAFREFAQVHDQDLKADVPTHADSQSWWSDLLQHLAFAMMQGDSPVEFRLSLPKSVAEDRLTQFLTEEQFDKPRDYAKRWLNDLLNHHLIQPVIQSNFEEHIEFRHQLIQEYYAAEHLLKLLPNLTDEQLKRDYLNYLKWTEPVALMLALENSEAQAIRVVQLALDVDWMLGARLAGEVKREFQAQTVKFVEELEVPDWLKVRLLGETRSEQAISGLLKLLEDSDWHVRESAAKALGEIASEVAVLGLLPRLEDTYETVLESAAEALGKIGSESAVPGLLKLLEGSHWAIPRSAAVEALGKIASEAAIPGLLKLLKNSDWFVSHRASATLGIIGSKMAIPGLLKLLEDANWYVRNGIAVSLGEIGSDGAIPGLLKLLEDDKRYVRDSAAEALGKIGSEAVISELLQRLEHNDAAVRESAAKALGEIGSEVAISGLLKLLEDDYWLVRKNAVEALGKIGSEVAVPSLLKLLEDDERYVRDSVAKALGEIGSEVAIPGLLKLLQDADSLVRHSAAEALGEIGSKVAISGLLKLLEDDYWLVRKNTVEALGKIGSEVAVPSLLKLLKDDERSVRDSVAKALGEIGSEVVIPGLLKLLEDADSFVGHSAAEALGKIGSEAVIPGLLKLLEDAQKTVRWRAAKALGKIGSESAIPGLLKLLKHVDKSVREIAPTALGEIGFEAVVPGLLQRLEDTDGFVRESAVKTLDILAKKRPDALSPHLTHLHTLFPTQSGERALEIISTIQDNCKFYNYSIQKAVEDFEQDVQHLRDQRVLTLANEP